MYFLVFIDIQGQVAAEHLIKTFTLYGAWLFSVVSQITVNVITQCNYAVTAIIGWTVMCEQWVVSGALWVPNVHSQGSC